MHPNITKRVEEKHCPICGGRISIIINYRDANMKAVCDVCGCDLAEVPLGLDLFKSAMNLAEKIDMVAYLQDGIVASNEEVNELLGV